MLDSRILFVGGTIRLTVPTYASEVLTTPSDITVTAYKNGSATGDSISPSYDHYGTGLSLVSYSPTVVQGDTITLKISATVSGTTRVTVAEFVVVTPQTGDAYARLGAPAGESIAADIAGIGAGATAAQVWSYASRTLTQSASQVDAVVSGSTVTLVRGTSISFSLTGLGTLTDRSKLWVTGKANANDPDSAAIFQIEETAGLLRIGGAAPATGETGTITVTDASAGNITVTLSAAAATKMKLVDGGAYDVKWKIGSTVLATAAAVLNVQADVTRVVA